MHPHQKSIEAAIATLRKTHSDISEQLSNPEIFGLKNRTLQSLEQQINYLSVSIGADGLAETSQKSTPIKKMFGKELAKTPEQIKEAIKPKTPEQIAAEELKVKVEGLYPNFNELEPDAIIDGYSELEIRGIGKLAGLPVTETSPKKVDVKFINQIKEAIKKKAELEAAGKE